MEQTHTAQTLTEPYPTHAAEVPAEPEPAAPPEVDYFDTFNAITSGERLQLMRALSVTESEIATTGTAQLLAVVWKHHKRTTGAAKIEKLLDLTERELLSELGLSDKAYTDQINDWVTNRGEASKS